MGGDAARSRADELSGTFGFAATVAARGSPAYKRVAELPLHGHSCQSDGRFLKYRSTVTRTYGIDSDLTFRVVERPRIGQVRIIQTVGESDELLHLAEDQEAAELWLAKAGYRNARLELVCADAVGADIVEGRAAA